MLPLINCFHITTAACLFSHHRYSVFGLGSSAYPNFCAYAHYVDNIFHDLGAERIYKTMEGDELCGQEESFKNWAKNVFKVIIVYKYQYNLLFPRSLSISLQNVWSGLLYHSVRQIYHLKGGGLLKDDIWISKMYRLIMVCTRREGKHNRCQAMTYFSV